MSRGRGTPRMTRKHLARAQRDRIRSRWILGGAIVIGVAVFGLLAFAFFGVPIMEERQPIATINGEVVTVREFKARVRLIQLSMINEYQYAQNILQIYADEPSISAFYQQRIDQLTSELDNPGLQGQRALEGMINEILIRQEANSRGIFVTREEVDDAVAVKDFNYYAEGTPTPQPSPTPRPSPTAEPSPTADPTARATSTPWPTPTEALAQASATPSSDAAPTSSPTPIPTPTPFTEDAFLATYGVQMEFLTEIGILEDDYLAVTEGELYRERLMAEVEQDLAREEDQVWLRHILVEDADEARGVLQRFADGETWEDLAAELSLDDLTKNDGGDLGWLASQDLAADYGDAFAIVAFATEIDDAAGPLETESGWHAIQILGHEVRILSDFDFGQRLQDAFDDLLADLMTEGELEVDEDWPDYIPHPSELARQVVE